MGESNVRSGSSSEELKEFMKHLIKDIRALEIMIDRGMIEENVHRIGAEQELCLIDKTYRPAPRAQDILEKLNHDKFTHELSRFNLEINLDPQEFKGPALRLMEEQLKKCLSCLKDVLDPAELDYILVGILPSIRLSDMTLENLTPLPRYFALNERLSKMRGEAYEFRIEGTDELITKHDSLMFESCNTSFQVHFQVGASNFTSFYNWAQAITGPLLSACTNSPLLFGKRLWRETRIALFQQSTDTRSNHQYAREEAPRVLLGNTWLNESIVDLFKEDVARYRVLISSDINTDSLEQLKNGEVPSLSALKMHNGTIYKWNRACFGETNGIPHLRIENRYIPSGPTVLDEMANTAFWLGLMHGMPEEYSQLHKTHDFDIVKANFNRACRMGMGSMFRWLDNKVYSAHDLILDVLVPMAEKGLRKAKIHEKDIKKYLQVIKDRVSTGNSGSQWILNSYDQLKNEGTKDEMMLAITAGIAKRQKRNVPVHKWSLAKIGEAGSWINRYWRIDQIMSVNLITVNENDLLDMVPNIMDWRGIRHILVENDKNELVGLLTSGNLIRYYSTRLTDETQEALVKDVMIKNPVTVTPDTLTKDAISLMRKNKIGCLPVVRQKKELIGIVTEHDFVNVADHFLQEFLKD